MLSHRPATMADAELLFAWRNDPMTRAMSRETAPVAWQDHLPWLGRALADPDRRICIVEHDGTPVATFRYDYGDEIEFSITISPEWRGRGLSRAIAALGVSIEPHSIAYIKAENFACQKLLAAIGYRKLRGGPLQRWRYDEHPSAHSISNSKPFSSSVDVTVVVTAPAVF